MAHERCVELPQGYEVMLTALIELLGDFSTAFFFCCFSLKKYSLLAKIALGSWFALRMQFAGAGAVSWAVLQLQVPPLPCFPTYSLHSTHAGALLLDS